MGNTASCTPYTASIKVINGDGRLEEYWHMVRAAEIMVENPGQFICDSSHLAVGCRIPGLTADEELEPRRLYFLLPMDMLYSVLTEEEMAALSCKAPKAMKRGGRRILPVLSDFCLFPAESKQVMKDPCSLNSVQVNVKMVRQRSWRPALDTIEEVP